MSGILDMHDTNPACEHGTILLSPPISNAQQLASGVNMWGETA